MNVFLGLLEATVLIALLIGLVAIVGKFSSLFSKHNNIK